MSRRDRWLVLPTVVVGVLSAGGFGCAERANVAADPWQYGVKLGDSREQVRALLGMGSPVLPNFVQYFSSGVNVTFDEAGKVVSLTFDGPAVALEYHDDPADLFPIDRSLPSEREVVFGLTPRDDERAFRRRLGAPPQERLEDRGGQRHCLWRKDGYVLNARFLATGRTHEGANYPAGTLMWVSVSRGL